MTIINAFSADIEIIFIIIIHTQMFLPMETE
jgi:hypothetical protein